MSGPTDAAADGAGIVYLVGAGPGDPALLTVRARQLLDEADVVAYDELCGDALLAAIPAAAELLPVGRRGHSGPRAEHVLHPLVLARARAGLRVVRLKAGDPLVFGRGGEEAAALRAAGVRFEIVPGVSSALGAAAYAGIPLTQRGVASAVTLATGHEALAGPIPAGTIVLFMAARRLAENLGRLVAGGRAPATPAAYVAAATTARQRVVRGTLADLAARVAAADVDADAPALVFVGEVVALGEALAWIEARPLFGRRVVVGRARPGRSAIAARLGRLGAEVIEAPEVGLAPPSSWAPFDRAFAELGAFSAALFASAEAVAAALGRLGARGVDVRTLLPTPLGAIGPAAAAALRGRGLVPAVETAGACAAALPTWERRRDQRRLLLVADESGRPQLAAALRARGADVHVVAVHRHTLRWSPLRGGAVDLVIVPSSSAALHLGDGPHAAALRPCRWLAMGPSSEAAARRVGAAEVVRADHDDLDTLVRYAEALLS